MIKVSYAAFALILLFAVLLAACAPQTVPAPPPPAAVQPAPTARAQTPVAGASEDATWLKVVEAAKKEGTLTIYSFNLVGDVGITVSKALKRNMAFL